MSMTSYIEHLIDTDIDSGRDDFAVALVLQGDILKFVSHERFSDLIINSVTGDPIRAVITDSQSSEILSAFKLVMNSDLCDNVCNLPEDNEITQDTFLFLNSGEAVEVMLRGMFPFDIKEAIFK